MSHSQFYIESVEDLKEKLISFAEVFENSLMDLQKSDLYKNRIDNIFRDIHSIKALSMSAKMDVMTKTFKIVEDVFDILRYKQPPIKQEIIDWLLMLSDYFKLWAEDFENEKYEIEPVDQYTLNMIKTSAIATYKSNHILKSSSILLYGQPDMCMMFEKPIMKEAGCFIKTSSKDETIQNLNSREFHIILICSCLPIDDIKAVKDCIKDKKVVPVIVVTDDKLTKKDDLDFFISLGVKIFLKDNLSNEQIKNSLEDLIKIHNEQKWIQINDKIVTNQISKIEPLPDSIKNILKVVNDANSSTSDLVDILMKDGALSASILKIINSPYYNLKTTVSYIKQAVMLLGKNKIADIALQHHSSKLYNSVDLSMYGLNDIRIMYSISNKRMQLMEQWYSKIKISMLPILSTSAYFGNLGQIILAQECKKRGISSKFLKVVNSVGPTVAEAEFFNMTSEDVTAEIFSYWGLEPLLIDSIKYAYDFQNAPSEAKKYAIPNFVVYSSINSIGESLDEENINEMVNFLDDLNISSKLYKDAVEKITNTEFF